MFANPRPVTSSTLMRPLHWITLRPLTTLAAASIIPLSATATTPGPLPFPLGATPHQASISTGSGASGMAFGNGTGGNHAWTKRKGNSRTGSPGTTTSGNPNGG